MSLLGGIASYLFGPDPISDEFERMQAEEARRQAEAYRAREARDYANTNRYVGRLWNVVNGSAPSAAQRQLVANVDQIQRGANSLAAGAEGNNAGIARYGAILSGGDAMAAANQAAGIQQAQEIADAQRQIGAAYDAQGRRSAGLYGTAAGIGLNYDQIAAQKQAANQKAEAAATGGLLSTAGTLGAAAIGGPAAAAAPAIAALAPSQAAGVNSVQSPAAAANGGGYWASMNANPGYTVVPDAYSPPPSPAGTGYDPYGYAAGRRGAY